MKTIGIIGGLGPESTVDYYKSIISSAKGLNGGTQYPEMVVLSVDLNRFMAFVKVRDWKGTAEWLLESIGRLRAAGADFAAIASNTPHIVFDAIRDKSPIPLISIVEATVDETVKLGLKRPGLLGTLLTMTSDFYPEAFRKRGMSVAVPLEKERAYIEDKLFTEIELGIFRDETRNGLLSIVKRMMKEEGIDSVILGCTELPLILTESAFGIPFLNTTAIHCAAIMALLQTRDS